MIITAKQRNLLLIIIIVIALIIITYILKPSPSPRQSGNSQKSSVGANLGIEISEKSICPNCNSKDTWMISGFPLGMEDGELFHSDDFIYFKEDYGDNFYYTYVSEVRECQNCDKEYQVIRKEKCKDCLVGANSRNIPKVEYTDFPEVQQKLDNYHSQEPLSILFDSIEYVDGVIVMDGRRKYILNADPYKIECIKREFEFVFPGKQITIIP